MVHFDDQISEPEDESPEEDSKEDEIGGQEVVVHRPHTISLPFPAWIMEENSEQKPLVFSGVLAKWHGLGEVTKDDSHTPSFTESQEEIKLFEGEGARGDRPSKKRSAFFWSPSTLHIGLYCSGKAIRDE